MAMEALGPRPSSMNIKRRNRGVSQIKPLDVFVE